MRASSDRISKTWIRKSRFREFFGRAYRPMFLPTPKPRNIQAYLEAIGHWERLTDDAPLDKVSTQILSAFRDALGALPGRKGEHLAPRTVNKTLICLRAMLRAAGPGGANRPTFEALPRVPWVTLCCVRRRLPKLVEMPPLVAIYQAAEHATQPVNPGLPAAAWWQAFIVLALTSGLRRGALLTLAWPDVDLLGRTVRVDADNDKAGCERLKALHPLVVQHLTRIRTGGQKVFPFACASITLDRQWRRLQRIGRVNPPLTIHDLKRGCATLFAPHVTAWELQQILDHSSIQTSLWYVNQATSAREAVGRIELPPQFTPGLGLVG